MIQWGFTDMLKPFSSTFSIFLLYRLSSVLIIQTSYVPDEYWQSLEVAHNMVFGYGYLTWEWKQGLRSYLYPFFFSVFYKVLELLCLDYSFLIIFVPKIFQACLTALSDHYFFLLCRNFRFQDYWTKLVIFTNWFWYYCGCRTLTNTFEAAFTTTALYYYPWDLFVEKKKEKSFDVLQADVKGKSIKYLTLAAINCLVRPTAATIWGPLVIFQLFSMNLKHIKEFLLNCVLPASLISLLASLILDYFWYGKFIIPAYNFIIFNIFEGISSFYGTHTFFWYITQGLPVVLGIHCLPFFFGFILLLKTQLTASNNLYKKVYSIWLFVLGLNIIILSNIPHKEFRFLLPLTPLVMLIVVNFLTNFSITSNRRFKFCWTLLSIVGFLAPSLFFGILHQRGTLKLMDYLRESVAECKPNCFFLFLMPCHSTPLYSHLHVNVSTRFLTCEPPLMKDHYDESEDFFNNPVAWLNGFWNDEKIPSHIAFFDSIESLISPFLKQKGYVKKNEFLHTLLPEGNVGKHVVVYEPS